MHKGEIKKLAQVLFSKRKDGEKPLLLLGAGISIDSGSFLNRDLMEGIVRDYHGDDKIQELEDRSGGNREEYINKFLPTEYQDIIKQRSISELYGVFAPYLQHHRPSFGYDYFAKLLHKGYFDWIITTNFDPLVEEALSINNFPMSNFILYIRDFTDPDIIAHHINRNFNKPAIKLLKLHGDVNSRVFDATEDDIKTFSEEEKKRLVPALVNMLCLRDLIVIGHQLGDQNINCLLEKAGFSHNKNSIWWYKHSVNDISDSDIPDIISHLEEGQKIDKNKYIVENGFDNLMQKLYENIRELELKENKPPYKLADFEHIYYTAGMTVRKDDLVKKVVAPSHVETPEKYDDVSPIYFASLSDMKIINNFTDNLRRNRYIGNVYPIFSDEPQIVVQYIDCLSVKINSDNIDFDEYKQLRKFKKGIAQFSEFLYCSRINSLSDFREDEFRIKEVENLCKAIEADNYNFDLNTNTSMNSLQWLNEVLKVPNFYKSLREKKKDLKFSEAAEDMIKKTQDYRSKSWIELEEVEKNIIKRLNRLLLEETYLQTPKKLLKIFIDKQRDVKSLFALKSILLLSGHKDYTKYVDHETDADIIISVEESSCSNNPNAIWIKRFVPFMLNGISTFYIKEFKKPLTVECLCNVIKLDEYDLSLKANTDTIDWLNELLEVPDFYERLKGKRKDLKFSEAAENMIKITQGYRSKSWTDLEDDERNIIKRNIIKRLNRLLLEEAYPQETPKSPEENFLYQTLCDAFLDDKLFFTIGGPEHNKILELFIGLHRWSGGTIVFNESNMFDMEEYQKRRETASISLNTEGYVGGTIYKEGEIKRSKRGEMGAYIAAFTFDIDTASNKLLGGPDYKIERNSKKKVYIKSVIGMSAVGTMLAAHYLSNAKNYTFKFNTISIIPIKSNIYAPNGIQGQHFQELTREPRDIEILCNFFELLRPEDLSVFMNQPAKKEHLDMFKDLSKIDKYSYEIKVSRTYNDIFTKIIDAYFIRNY